MAPPADEEPGGEASAALALAGLGRLRASPTRRTKSSRTAATPSWLRAWKARVASAGAWSRARSLLTARNWLPTTTA